MYAPLASLARRPGVVHRGHCRHGSSGPWNAADAPEPRWTTERLARRLLDSIDRRLLVNRDQDDEVHDPRLPSQGDGGRAPSISISTWDARPWNAADLPQPRWTGERPFRLPPARRQASPGGSHQDDGCTALRLPSQGDPGVVHLLSVSRRRASCGQTGHMMWCAPGRPKPNGYSVPATWNREVDVVWHATVSRVGRSAGDASRPAVVWPCRVER